MLSKMSKSQRLKISVVTVCLNSEATIRRAIESVAMQTHPCIEYVIVDGGSSDNTLSIAAEFPDVVSKLISEKDKGIYDAMNKGIGLAAGEIIYFLNSDDALHDSEVIADVASGFDRTAGTHLVYGNVIYVKHGRTEHHRFNRLTRHNLVYGDLCHQAVFARRQLFENIGTFDTRFRINADYDWLLKVFRSQYVVAYLDRDIAYFNATGRHVADEQFLQRERHAVRMQYCSPTIYAVGAMYHRVARRLRKLTSYTPA